MKHASKYMLVLTLALSLSATVFGGDDAMNPCGGKHGMVLHVNDPMGRNSVTFKSEAPLEDIVGTSNDITGQIWFDPASPEKGGHGELTIPVATINTGIPLRDDHLKGADWLDADRYPNIVLKINKVNNVQKVKTTNGAETYDVTVHGDFSLHGKTQPVEFSGRITYLKESDMTRQRLSGDLLAARATFTVPLKNYSVTGPAGMDLIGSKVGETIDVEITLVGNTVNAMASGADNPCGGKAMAGADNPCGGKAMAGAENPCGGKAEAGVGNPCGVKADNKAANPCSP